MYWYRVWYIKLYFRTTFTVQTKVNPSNIAYTAKPLSLHTDQTALIYQPGVRRFEWCLFIQTQMIPH